ncbi:Serine--tRNA ligase, mitochondrial [Pichia californica]|uniref:serine--tRNA ligase n=1 Tax=Pichia californica TaxID=460514 RepID=A0A9P6WI17_9ASCO|nr:Serine--tRNA ligase, mitochondrial [[Candida] californica]KAG0687149.1 Serine--tRNA ligase, mitochondrial [[Candida] californica]
MWKRIGYRSYATVGSKPKSINESDSIANIRTTNTLKRAQLDLKKAYQEYDTFKEICSKRNVPFPLLDTFKTDYEHLQKITETVLNFKHESKNLQKVLKDLKIAQKKSNSNNTIEQEQILDKLTKFKPILNEKSKLQSELEDKLFLQISSLPNYIHSSVESKQILVEYLNPTEEIKNSKTDDFEPKSDSKFDHKEIMEELGLVNFSQATKISGRGWYYLIGDAALLEQALIQFALKKARQAGFQMILPPSIVKTEVTNACGFMPRDTNNERQVYELQNDDLCLTGTAEIPLAALYANHEFKSSELPLNLVGLSRSYRAEAGAAGRDTRGLYRVHEFTKVELFSWTFPDEKESMRQFDSIVAFQKDFINSLGLTARVLIMPHDDLGAPAYKKIDIEVLMPGRGTWGEVSSTSNCLEFQSRRLITKVRDSKDGKLKFVHTLNGTACAVPRVVLAIIENFYDPKTKTITIPEVLRPYMDDKTIIKGKD